MRKVYDLRYEGGKCPLGWEYVEGYSRDGITVHGYCRKISSRKASHTSPQLPSFQKPRNVVYLPLSYKENLSFLSRSFFDLL